jgi:hypothetical protein
VIVIPGPETLSRSPGRANEDIVVIGKVNWSSLNGYYRTV